MAKAEKRIRIISEYQRVFREGPGKTVLLDLMSRFHIVTSTFDPNDREHARMEGERNVVLHILAQLGYDTEKLLAEIEEARKLEKNGGIMPPPEAQPNAGNPGGDAGAAGGKSFLNDNGGGAAAIKPPAGDGTPAAKPLENPWPKEDWRHNLPEDIRGEESIKVFNDVSSLAKGFVHTKKALGADKVALPSKHATPEEVQEFYTQLGRPPLDKYEVPLPKEAKFVNQDLVNKIKPIAHKSGLKPEQLAPLLEFYEAETAANDKVHAETVKAGIDTGMANLQKEWGETFKQRGAWAKRLFTENGSPELAALMDENVHVGSNAHMIKFAAKIGELLYKEDTIKGGGEGGGSVLSPSEALSKYNSIMGDAKHPYKNSDHPGHKDAVQEVARLFQMAYPEQQA